MTQDDGASGETREDLSDPPARSGTAQQSRGPLLVRIAVLLTLALLPLGVIAVVQTERAIDAAQQTYRASLRAQTARIVTPEREAIIVAFGVARGLAGALSVLDPDDVDCTAMMNAQAEMNPRIAFVGFTNQDAISRCNNFDREFDFSDDATTQRLFADPQPDVNYLPRGNASELPVIAVSEPVYAPDGEFRGFVSLSFSGRDLVEAREPSELPAEVSVLTFNAHGEILTGDVPEGQLDDVLPADIPLTDLVNTQARVFSAVSGNGTMRDFALVPIAPGAAYALGSWSPMAPASLNRVELGTALLFPILMWLISLTVALLAIRNQVIVPVKSLGRTMRSFADGRRILHSDTMSRAPAEIHEISDTFATMARKIIRDEADLENAVHERDVLLKEVHHRVKNNLQLMSSIMNMQIRRTTQPEVREALRNVQDRLSSLATVHRGLYQAPEVSRVPVDSLLSDIFKELSSLAAQAGERFDLTLNLDPVTLVPDQAGPLALLATETFTNSLKYCCPAADGKSFISVSLKTRRAGEDEMIVLEVANSVAKKVDESDLTQLGRQLIIAFAQQLDAEVERESDEHRYVVRVTFRPEAFKPE